MTRAPGAPFARRPRLEAQKVAPRRHGEREGPFRRTPAPRSSEPAHVIHEEHPDLVGLVRRPRRGPWRGGLRLSGELLTRPRPCGRRVSLLGQPCGGGDQDGISPVKHGDLSDARGEIRRVRSHVRASRALGRSPGAGLEPPRPLQHPAGWDEFTCLGKLVADRACVLLESPHTRPAPLPAPGPAVANRELLEVASPRHTTRAAGSIAHPGIRHSRVVLRFAIVSRHQVQGIGHQPEAGSESLPTLGRGVLHQRLGTAVEKALGIPPLVRFLGVHGGESLPECRHGCPVLALSVQCEPEEHVAPPDPFDATRTCQFCGLAPATRLGQVEHPLPEYPAVSRNLGGERRELGQQFSTTFDQLRRVRDGSPTAVFLVPVTETSHAVVAWMAAFTKRPGQHVVAPALEAGLGPPSLGEHVCGIRDGQLEAFPDDPRRRRRGYDPSRLDRRSQRHQEGSAERDPDPESTSIHHTRSADGTSLAESAATSTATPNRRGTASLLRRAHDPPTITGTSRIGPDGFEPSPPVPKTGVLPLDDGP